MSQLRNFRKTLQRFVGAFIITLITGPALGYLAHLIFNAPFEESTIVAYAISFVFAIYWLRMNISKVSK